MFLEQVQSNFFLISQVFLSFFENFGFLLSYIGTTLNLSKNLLPFGSARDNYFFHFLQILPFFKSYL
jgi:hypothetical protein